MCVCKLLVLKEVVGAKGFEPSTSSATDLPEADSMGARRSATQILRWRSQRFLREVEAIGHIVGSLISCIQWLQPKCNL
jgi:hypothetical protein